MISKTIPKIIRVNTISIWRVSSLALSAFLTSAANTRDLQDRMLVACNVRVETMVASTRNTWSSFNALPCPNDTDARRQRSWDEPNVTHDMKAIWEEVSSEMDKARLLASKAPYSSDWLYAIPIWLLTRTSESLSVCACAWTFVSHIHALVEQWSPQEGHTDYPVKKLWPLHSSPTDQRRNLEGFEACRCSLNKRTSRPTRRWWKAFGRVNHGAMAKWSHVGRHCCRHYGQLLHTNDVSDILWSSGGSSNAEES